MTHREAMQSAVDKMNAALKEASGGGGAKYQERHRSRGKLLPRERIAALVESGSFLEIAALAGYEVEGEMAGAGVVGGIGRVSGRECAIIANEATVKAGAISPLGFKKLTRLAEIALENKLPTVYMVESAGVELPQQSKIFVEGGREFRDLTRRSREKLPTIALVFGTSTAGGAYIPGMSDYTVFVKGQGRAFLGGPPLVKMATGETVDEDALGGAEMHAVTSGLADYLAESEAEAISIARELVSFFVPRAESVEPKYPAEELLDIVPASFGKRFDVRDVLIRFVDGSRFHEFKPLYGPNLVTGFARIDGLRVGILANNGFLESASAGKGAHFIQLCNQSDIPLLFVQNITGFLVGRRVEEEGIIRAGARLINAVANSSVPAITLNIGASFGAGNYAMSGRSFEPRFVFSWPNYRIGVMGGKQLGGVLDIIKREAAGREGRSVDEAELKALREGTEAQSDRETDAFFATARVWDDGLIDPREARKVLARCLSLVTKDGVNGTLSWGTFR